jgi:membrane-associated phospholipid phosphatase
MLAINRNTSCGAIDWLMPRLTDLHNRGWFWFVVAPICVAFLWRGPRRTRAWVLCALVAVALSDSLAFRVVKKLVPRDRPCHVVAGAMVVPDVRVLPNYACRTSPSFPSNHASNMMAVGLVCWWFTRRRARWAWFLLPLVIGFSRVYLGVHYPSDVLGGWAMGAMIAAACLAVTRQWLPDDDDVRREV